MGISSRGFSRYGFFAAYILVLGGGCKSHSSSSAIHGAGSSGPVIESFFPDSVSSAVAGDPVVFSVTVRELGPINYRWTVDGVQQNATASQFALHTSVNDSAVHTVAVDILTDERTTTLVWRVTMLDGTVNHPPVIASAMPPEDVSVTGGTQVSFSITATDADVDDGLTYSWSVDGVDQQQSASWVNLDSSLLSLGDHLVEVKVSDGQEEAAHVWTVTVEAAGATNQRPVIESAVPQGVVRINAGSTLNLEVTASDPEGDPLAYRWTVDGELQSSQLETFSYLATAASAGVHTIQVTVHDGENNGQDPSYNWNVTVIDDSSVTVQVAWDPVLTDVRGGAENVAGYRVFLAEASGQFDSPIATVSTPLAELTSLRRGVSYIVSVIAFDQAGNESSLSEPLTLLVE